MAAIDRALAFLDSAIADLDDAQESARATIAEIRDMPEFSYVDDSPLRDNTFGSLRSE